MTNWTNDVTLFVTLRVHSFTPNVDHAAVWLKWTPDHCDQENQWSDLCTTSVPEDSIHTSPVVAQMELEGPQLQKNTIKISSKENLYRCPTRLSSWSISTSCLYAFSRWFIHTTSTLIALSFPASDNHASAGVDLSSWTCSRCMTLNPSSADLCRFYDLFGELSDHTTQKS